MKKSLFTTTLGTVMLSTLPCEVSHANVFSIADINLENFLNNKDIYLSDSSCFFGKLEIIEKARYILRSCDILSAYYSPKIEKQLKEMVKELKEQSKTTTNTCSSSDPGSVFVVYLRKIKSELHKITYHMATQLSEVRKINPDFEKMDDPRIKGYSIAYDILYELYETLAEYA